MVQVICIVVLFYYVVAVLPLITITPREFDPHPLTALWFNIYGNMIVSCLILTTFLPYIGICLNWFFNMLRCKPPSGRYMQNYNLIRRNAHLISVTFIVFTYGFAMPILFIAGTVCLAVKYILDKLLVTYFYRQNTNHNENVSKIIFHMLKYAPVLYFVWGGTTLLNNACMVSNTQLKPISYSNKSFICEKFTLNSLTMYVAAMLLLLVLIFVDVM